MQITEIFHSIQGESSRAGLPCTFVRLTACNLRCQWCDTTYSFYGGTKMTLEKIMQQIEKRIFSKMFTTLPETCLGGCYEGFRVFKSSFPMINFLNTF